MLYGLMQCLVVVNFTYICECHLLITFNILGETIIIL